MKNNESAQAIATLDVPICPGNFTVKDVFSLVKERDFKVLDYVYVLDDEKRIKGVFSLRELLTNKDNLPVEKFMRRKVVRVPSSMDREKVALLALRKGLKSVPVVDEKGRFVGVVPSSVILDTLYREHREDALRFVGILNGTKGGVARTAGARMPFLVLGLLGGIFAAQIVTFFESALKEHFLIAAFIPLIVYMADAVGAQTQTLYIRSLLFPDFENKSYFFREVGVSLILSSVLGLFLFLFINLFFNNVLLAFIMGLSLFLTVSAAVLISIVIPFIFHKIKIDPALGSGPFATIIADITSLLIYFKVASFLLSL